MSDFDRNFATARSGYRTDQVAIDAGLRAHMIRVYNYMASRRSADRYRVVVDLLRRPVAMPFRSPAAGSPD